MAFEVSSFRGKGSKDDTRYVKYIFRLFGKDEGKHYQKVLKHHECTERDFQEFGSPMGTTAEVFDKMLANEARKLYCIDWDS